MCHLCGTAGQTGRVDPVADSLAPTASATGCSSLAYLAGPGSAGDSRSRDLVHGPRGPDLAGLDETLVGARQHDVVEGALAQAEIIVHLSVLPSRSTLYDLLGLARPGASLVVQRVDRLGRSRKNLSGVVGELQQRGVAFASVTEQIDTSTPASSTTFGASTSGTSGWRTRSRPSRSGLRDDRRARRVGAATGGLSPGCSGLVPPAQHLLGLRALGG